MGERDQNLRYDGDVEDPLRSAQCHLNDAMRLFAIGIASASARWGRGPRVMGGASCSFGFLLDFSWCVASFSVAFLLARLRGPFDKGAFVGVVKGVLL